MRRFQMYAAAAVAVGCGGQPQSTHKAPVSASVDTAAPSTTDSSVPADTADPFEPVGATVGADVVASGVRTCPEPDARTTSGPFLHVEGALDAAGLPDPPSFPVGAGVTAADFNQDGHLDLLLAQYDGMDLFFGDGTGGLVHQPDRLPAPSEALANHAASVAADFDLDGDLDVVVVNRSAPDALWWNDGTGRFVADPTAPFSTTPRASVGASLADVDGDGDLDLFIAGHSNDSARDPADPSALYLWTDNQFVHAEGALPAASHAGFTFNGTWFDADGDGDLDLYMVNDHGTLAEPNHLLRNDSTEDGVVFVAHPDAGLDATMLGMGLAMTDFNADARPDLIVTNFGQLSLFESMGDGTWYEASLARGLVQEPETQVVGWSVVAEDFDNDADVDVWATFGSLPAEATVLENPFEQPDALWLQSGGRFHDVAPIWGVDDPGVGRGGLAIDLNEDGYLDLVTAPLVTRPMVHLSRCGSLGWLMVDLEQPGPNPSAIGATVSVVAGGTVHRRWVVAGGTQIYGSPPAVVHVGVGDSPSIDAVVVTWPDGETSEVGPFLPNQVLRVVRRE